MRHIRDMLRNRKDKGSKSNRNPIDEENGSNISTPFGSGESTSAPSAHNETPMIGGLDESKKLQKFPMMHLVYDMKLPIMKHIRVNEAKELCKASKSFRALLFNEPSLIFSKNVAGIEVSHTRLAIKKFHDDSPILINIFRDRKLINEIQTCRFLRVVCAECERLDHGVQVGQLIDACCRRCHHRAFSYPQMDQFANFMAQLHSVDELLMALHFGTFKILFAEFKAPIISSITLTLHDMEIAGWTDPEALNHFAENHLEKCKKIELKCWNEDQFSLYRQALSKSSPDIVVINPRHHVIIHDIFRSFNTRGIVGRNREAAFFFISLKPNVSLADYSPAIEELEPSQEKEEICQMAAEDFEKLDPGYDESIIPSCYYQVIDRDWNCYWVTQPNSGKAMAKFICRAARSNQ